MKEGNGRGSFGSACRYAAVVAALMLAATVLAACGSDKSSSGGADKAGAKESPKGKKVVLVACGDVNPWCKVYNSHILAGLKKAGVQTSYLQDPFDPALQVQHLNQAIAQKPDAILLVASDDNSVVPSLKKAKSAGVPVFNLNGRPADAAVPFLQARIEADQKALGKYAAENVVEGLKKRGLKQANVMAITGTAGTNTSKDRMQAFRETLAADPGYKLVEVQDGNWDQVKTAKIAQQLFAKYRDKMDAAYGMADYQAAGIIQSASQAGVKLGVDNKGLIVTGSNCFKVGIDNVTAGKQYGTATQAPGPEGDFVFPIVTKFLSGETVDKVNLNQESRVTKANLAKWREACSQA